MDLNRRKFLSFAPLLGVGMFQNTFSKQQTPYVVSNNIYNVVEDFGADPTNTNDSTLAVQNAVNVAQSAKGGVVWFPPGKYKITGIISITKAIIFAGVGCNPGNIQEGSWLYLTEPTGGSYLPHPIWIRGQSARGTVIQNLGFYYPNQQLVNGNPKSYGYTIAVESDDVSLQSIHLHNSYNGILLQNLNNGEGSVGRILLDGITGQPINNGIFIDTAKDSIKINNVHFWPFWSQNPSYINWIFANGIAIKSKRNDNPHFSNIFALGYKYGMQFTSDASGNETTHKFRVVNADMDMCWVGLQIEGHNTTGQIANFTAQGSGAIGESSLIGLAGIRAVSNPNGVRLQGSNVRLSFYSANAIRAEGNGTKMAFENLWVEGWNSSGNGFPGVEAVGGAEIKIGFGDWFEAGNNAPNTGGNVLVD